MSRIHRRSLTVLVAGAALALGGAAATVSATGGGKHGGRGGPAVIALPSGWQPEGIASGPGDKLYVGSIPTGRVIEVDPRTGRSRIVVAPREGRSATGLKVDRRRLYVAGARTGHAYVYDARTGGDLADLTLSEEPAFINDVTLTRRAAWFTDSTNPRLYKVDRDDHEITRVPITGELQYDADPATIDANGIVATGRSLLVIQSRTGRLFRVDPATGASVRVPLTGGDGGGLPNGDGMLLKGRTLYVVQNRLNTIAVVKLAGDLRSGAIVSELTDPAFQVPTTVAKARGALYTVNAKFGVQPTPTAFEVVRVGRTDNGRRRGRDDDHRGRGHGDDD